MANINKIKRALRNTSTPFYLYDTSSIKKNYLDLKNHLPQNFDIFYAIKANPHKKVVSLLCSLGAGADVASAGELTKALASGVKPSNISFAGPGKTEEELEFAIRRNIASISVECREEALIIDTLSRKLKKRANVSVRVNPALGSLHGGVRMGGGSQQFGIDEETVPEVIEVIKNCRHIDLIGVHAHTGSQILSEETLAENMVFLLNWCIQLTERTGVTVKFINFGGGLGIPYYQGQKELDVKKLGLLINGVVNTPEVKKRLKNVRFVIEPGRYLVGISGVYVTRIIYKKKSREKTFLIVDGGMHQNLAAAGLLGEGLKRNRTFGVIRRKGSAQKEIVTVVGCLCTPLDILARDIELLMCEVGDYLYIASSGAYGYSASPLMFLSHSLPDEVII